MAIKISGTTVIDDSCNVTNANTFTATTFVGDGAGLTGVPASPTAVLKPENTNPADAATNIGANGANTTLCGSEYFSLYDKTHTCTCFQVSECSDFSTCNVFTCEIAGACTSLLINPEDEGLAASTQHFFRLRYEDEDGCCSNFSDATCFTTGNYFASLGDSICGGFYIGDICVAGTPALAPFKCYHLILAPNATGCAAACQYKTARTSTGQGAGSVNCLDGYGCTYDTLANGDHPAGNWTATRSINGFTDWYLPARCEFCLLFDNCGSLPAGEGFVDSAINQPYWSSTEINDAFSYSFQFATCGPYIPRNYKNCSNRVRAIRRVYFS